MWPPVGRELFVYVVERVVMARSAAGGDQEIEPVAEQYRRMQLSIIKSMFFDWKSI